MYALKFDFLLVHCSVGVLLFLNLVQSWRSFNTDILGYQFEILDNITVNHFNIGIITAKNRNVLNGSLSFSKDISEFMVELAIVVPRPNDNEIRLLDMTLNGCEVLEGAFGNNMNMLQIILGEFRKVKGNLPTKCPLLKNKVIVLDNIFVDPDKFPPYMPEMLYSTKFHLLSEGKYLFKSWINGSVFSKKNRRIFGKRGFITM